MKKEYIVPSIVINKVTVQGIICTSAGDIEDGIGWGDEVEE